MKKRVRFKGYKFGEGWQWKAGGEGVVLAETDTAYKVGGFLWKRWVLKEHCEEITTN